MKVPVTVTNRKTASATVKKTKCALALVTVSKILFVALELKHVVPLKAVVLNSIVIHV